MSNPKRKMSTMRKVDSVTPIDGADRIEAVHVDGWTVVDQKGLWHAGDYCVFYEIDSFLPTNDDRYRFLAQFGEKTMMVYETPVVGHVLKTRRLRGEWSQGLLLKPEVALPGVPESAYESMYERGACLDGPTLAREYVQDNRLASIGFTGKYDPFVAPRTDAERVQNIDNHTFELVKRTLYFASVKVDGTSTTICYDPRVNRVRCFSHNNEYDLDEPGIGMTTANAAKRQGIWQWCEEHPGITVQAELCGPKIQNNRLKLQHYMLFVFSMWDMERRCYLDPHTYPGIATHCVPEYKIDLTGMTRDGLIAEIDGIKGNVTQGCLDEGVVFHVLDRGDLDDTEWLQLRIVLRSTMQVKVISNRYLLKAS